MPQAIPNDPIILAPIEFTLIINMAPIKIAISDINTAKILSTATGSNLGGRQVSATATGPPITVSEIIKAAKNAKDSMG